MFLFLFRKMRLSITFCCILLNIVFFSTAKKLKDEDFSEFDNFDDENPLPQDANHPSNKIEPIKTESAKVDDVTVDEENDDDTMFDDEEFENVKHQMKKKTKHINFLNFNFS